MGAAVGRLPDEAMRRRMAQYVDALPAAAAQGPRPDQGPGIALPAAILERYVGRYEVTPGRTLTIRRVGPGLVAQPDGMQEATLVAQSETRFSDPRGPVLEFQFDDGGTVTGLIVEQGGQRIPARRIR